MEYLEQFDSIVTHIENSEKLDISIRGAAKQAACAGGGAFVLGVAAGPPGAFAGGCIGAAVGYLLSDNYPNIYNELRTKLDNDSKQKFVTWVILVAGGLAKIFYDWYEKKENQRLVHDKMIELIGHLNTTMALQ